VIGVVLSGYQDCGTAGMMSVKARGGIGVVQDPATALAPDMPRNVLEKVTVDHVVHPLELPALLTKLVSTPAPTSVEPSPYVQQIEGTTKGAPTVDVVCPICEGVLTEAQPGLFQHFRCHTGHAFSLNSLVREQSEELERVLWAAIRALEESAALSRRISLRETGELRKRFAEKATTQQQQAEYIRKLVLHGDRMSPQDAREL
jgi:two-component system chemotaxis response regulator CheB